MANQIIIDIGAVANDGTGDPLRTAFGYVNNNFSNVWASGVANSNIQFNGNRILTVNTNGNLVLAPNGIGKVQANVDVVPNINNAHSLGAPTRRWNTVYTQFMDVAGDVDFAGNVIVSGNLTVQGDTIQLGNIVTDTKTIQLANTAGTTSQANGSGITVGANDNIATLLYNSANNVWTTNIGISVNGPVTGSSLAVSDATIYGNVDAINGNFTGNITADYFFGNGSQLTGLSTNSISDGNSSVAIDGVDGNAVITTNGGGGQWKFDTNGDLDFPGGTFAGDDIEGTGNFGFETPANVGFGILTNAGSQEWTFGTDGVLTLAGGIVAKPVGFPFTSTITNITTGNPTVIVDLDTSPFGAPVTGKVLIQGVVGTDQANETWFYQAVEANQFQLFSDAACTIPVDGTSWTAYSGGGTAYASAYDSMAISTGGLQVVAGPSSWYFGMDGNLNLAGGIASDSTIVIDNRASGNSADIQLYAADDITIQARDRTLGSESEGGDINIYAGDSAEDGDSSGGDVTIEAGRGGSANVDFGGSGGFITLRAGAGGDASTQEVGQSARGGGDLTLRAGDAGSNMGNIARGSNGGDVIINAGESTGNNSSGGDIRLNTGTAGPNALAGSLSINIPESAQSPGGSWVFDGTGKLTGPGSIEIGTGNTGVQLRSNQIGTGFYATIVNITNGLPSVVITLNDVEFIEGDQGTVRITGVEGETEANGFWGWRAVEIDQIQLYTDGTWSTPVDGSTWNAYVSGGVAVSSGYNNLDIQGGSVAIISGAGKYWSFNPEGTTVFPILTVTRGDRSGTLTGFTLNIGDGTDEAIISTPNGGSGGISDSQRLVINPGAGENGTTGEGGDIYLYAGRGGDAGGSGGDIKIRGGLGPVNGDGGYIDIVGGEADANGTGGYIELRGGLSGNAAGGVVRVIGGQGLNGAEANITGGTGSAGSGGAVNITGGTSSNGLAEYGNVNITSGASTWIFNNTGNLVLPQGGTISEGPSPSFLGDAVTITPANGSDADQQLKIYPTFAEGNHLHLTTGNLYNTEMYVGDDNLYVKLANTGDVVINSNDSLGNVAQWTFSSNGTLTLPNGDAAIVPDLSGTTAFQGSENTGVVVTSSGNAGSVTMSWVDRITDLANARTASMTLNSAGSANVQIQVADLAANTISNWTFDSTGNLTLPGNISGNTAGYAIGYRDIPQVSFTGNATIATSDAGKHFYSTQSTDYILTIANNASQGFQVGAAITVINQGTGNITIAQDSGVTLYLAGNATAANRTLSTFGMATIMKVATDTWFINGTGVS